MNASERFRQRLRDISPERAAQIEERVRQRLTDPNDVPPPLPDDGPDPFGLNWEWARPLSEGVDPNSTSDSANEKGVSITSPSEAQRKSHRRLPLAIVASIGIVAGVLVGIFLIRGEPSAPLFASVSLRGAPIRGPGSVPELRIENRSDRKAYVTVVGLSPNRPAPPIHYRENGQDIAVAPRSESTLSNLPAAFDGSNILLVVLTGSPRGEEIRGWLREGQVNLDPGRLASDLRERLEKAGERGASVEFVEVPKEN